MNPETNKFEQLFPEVKEFFEACLDKASSLEDKIQLVRSDGTPVPKHWSIFEVDEEIVIKNYTFRVAYINDSSIIFEPVGPVIIKANKER